MYVPKQGDIVFLSFSPQKGHEQQGHRPGLVLSRDLFNKKTGLAFIAPITSKEKNYPFRMALPSGGKTYGHIMIDQTRSLDYQGRNVCFVERLPADILEEVLEIFHVIFFL